MEKLIILDFTTGEVDIYNTQFENGLDDECGDIEIILKELGHKPGNCQWMITDGQITFHKEVLR